MMFSNRLALAALTLAALAACDGRRESKSGEATFRVENIDVSGKPTVSKNQTTLATLTRFQFKACLTDAVSHSAIQFTEFSVSDGTATKTATTDSSGCMLYSETHEIAIATPRVMRVRRYFTANNGFKGTVTVDLAFDPANGTWTDLRKFDDLPSVEEEVTALPFSGRVTSKLSSRNETTAKTYLTSASFSMRELSKEQSVVNRLLTLTTVQRFDMTLNPQYQLKNLDGDLLLRSVSAGDFRLSITIVREKIDATKKVGASDLIAAYDGKVSVREDGVIRSKVDLRVYDAAAALNHNNQMILTLEPIGDAASFARAGTYVGYLDSMNANSFDVKLDPAGDEAEVKEQLANNLRGLMNEETPKAVDLFVSQYGMKQAGADLAARIQAIAAQGRGSILQWVTRDLSNDLCSRIYSSDEKIQVTRYGIFRKTSDALTECRYYPATYLKIMDRDVVDEIAGQPIQRGDRQQVQKTITLSNTLTFGVSTDHSYGGSVKGSIGIGGSLSANFDPFKNVSGDSGSGGIEAGKKGASLGKGEESRWGFGGGINGSVGVNGELYTVYSYTKTNSKATSAGVSQSQQLVVYHDSYDIPAKVRRCFFLRGTTAKSQTVFTCADGITDKVLAEDYYYVNYTLPRSMFEDDNSATAQQWRFSMRGSEMAENFEKMMTMENVRLNFDKWISVQDANGRFLPDFKIQAQIVGTSSQENR